MANENNKIGTFFPAGQEEEIAIGPDVRERKARFTTRNVGVKTENDSNFWRFNE